MTEDVARKEEVSVGAEPKGSVSSIPFYDMRHEEAEAAAETQLQNTYGDTVPYYHVFLPAESGDAQVFETDTGDDRAEQPYFSKTPTPGACASKLEVLTEQPQLDTPQSHGAWEQDKAVESSAYQFFPAKAGNVREFLQESSTNPNLELVLGGKDRRNTQQPGFRSLPFFVHLVDPAVSSLEPGHGYIDSREPPDLTLEFPLVTDTKEEPDLLQREKRLGVEDNSRVLTSRTSTKDEYDCVVKRLRDPRGTIRWLAATAVREATRNSPQAREDLWRAGAIPPLVDLLQEEDMGVCYMATVALLNLAIGSARNKQDMADCGAISILVRLMRPDSTTTVRESATTVILSLAASDQLKPCIGSSGAIVYLSDILTNGTTQGRSDAVRALLNLSIFKGNRPIIVQAGVISPLYKVVLRDAKETAEKAVILLSHLFHDREGRETITAEEDTCSVLLQVLKRGTFSQTCKEQTVVILLALSAKMAVRREAVLAQGILPSLVEMALIGSSPKIQEQAAKLLRIIKEQRTDQGILSMDRVSGNDFPSDRIPPLERQYSSSRTMDSSVSAPPVPPRSSRRRVARSASSLSGKQVHFTKDTKDSGKSNLNYFRNLFGRSLRSEYLTCRTVSID